MDPTTHSREGNTLLSLVAGLREDVRILFHEELSLAKKEISEKVSYFGRNSIYLAIGGAVGYLAMILLFIAVAFLIASGFETLGLSTGMALFLGFLAIAVVSGSVGGILVGKALSAFKKQSLAPEKTIAALKEIKDGGLEQVQVPIKTYQTPAEPADPRSSAEIKSDLEQTRSRIGREVRGIKTRLNVATAAATVVAKVKMNPVRTVGIGLGTGLAGFVIMRVARLFGRRHTV